MPSSRIDELRASAPIIRQGRWLREGRRIFLCGTLGAAFDRWQRGLSAISAADGYFAQQIGLEEVESLMDALEEEARGKLELGERLAARRSPGYGDMPLELNRTILEKLDAGRKIGVTLTDSLLLAPAKSVTAICEII